MPTYIGNTKNVIIMKRIFTFLLIVFAYLTASAENVSEQQALQKAQQFMKSKQFIQSPVKTRRQSSSSQIAENAGYYVFNVENNGGFVIVAGDDRMTEILGYSEKGNVNIDSIPEQMKWLLDGYQTIYKKVSTSSANAPKVRRTTRASIEPLLTTEWGQGNPYNEMCPMIGNERCVAGCVATAMAQVVNYYRWPQESTKAIPAYTSASNNLTCEELPPTQFNWGYMGPKQIARLMRYCGQAVKMDYGLASSASDNILIIDALVDYFGFSSGAQCVFSINYSEEEWENVLHNELAAERPVVLSGTDTYRGGHSFIVHGYENGLFSINWGWDGSYDGNFALTNLVSTGGDYTLNQSAIIGITSPAGAPTLPKAKVEIKSSDLSDWNLDWRTLYNQKSDDGTFPSFKVKEKIVNARKENINVSIGYGLYSEQGLVEVLQQENHSFQVNEEYWHNATIKIQR